MDFCKLQNEHIRKYEFKSKAFNIRDFGATESDELQTREIQSALDTCFLSGGGVVVVPRGTYRTGGLRLRSGTVLYLEEGAVLLGSSDPLDYLEFKNDKIEPITEYDTEPRRSVYPYSRWNNGLIRVINAKNVAIIGEANSFIDGVDCYDPEGEEGYRGPHAINVQESENIYLDGYTVRNSANWAHAIFNSKNIEARGLTVLGGHDGFDVRTCDNVLVEDCEFYTGDDCIAGFDNNDVVVRNCILNSSCSALRFGGNNVLIEKCRGFGPGRYGHRYTLTEEEKRASAPTGGATRHNMYNAFLYYCDHRAKIRKAPGDILVRDCVFENPDSLFSLSFSEKHTWCRNRSLSSIAFENCVVSGVSRSIYASGDENEPITLTLKNMEISAREDSGDINVIDARHFEKITLDGVRLYGFDSPQIFVCTDGEIEIKDTTPIKIETGDTLYEYDC